MTVRNFSFAANANDFDQHIRNSIPGLDELRAQCVALSRDFIQSQTRVVDIGCSTGSMLQAIKTANDASRTQVRYIGLDSEAKFTDRWFERRAHNLDFRVDDARTFDEFQNMSLVLSLFTLQFVPERDRAALLRKLHDGLIAGGALIIAEKVLANTAGFQDLFTSAYHAYKRENFRPKTILDKERSLRGQMRLWTQPQLVNALCEAGFQREDIEVFWQNYLFIGMVAKKTAVQ